MSQGSIFVLLLISHNDSLLNLPSRGLKKRICILILIDKDRFVYVRYNMQLILLQKHMCSVTGKGTGNRS